MTQSLPTVCIQGLGFVGAAMATAVANARNTKGDPCFDVIGVDLPTAPGKRRIDAINAGRFPFFAVDDKLVDAVAVAHETGNLRATSDPAAYDNAEIVIVDIHLDVDTSGGHAQVNFDGFRTAMRTLGERMALGSLVLIETTVPPGTCERVVAPELAAALEKRGMKADSIQIAHSYERVMPGPDYFDSITNFWRVYAGLTPQAADRCEAFLRQIIDTTAFPISRLHSTTASETAKVLENSYRAANIALVDEWGRFAEDVGIDLFEVLAAIRMRPTHDNIRQPGFGVGGYCLTKDPMFSEAASRQLFNRPDLEFPFSKLAIETNRNMPLRNLARLRRLLGNSLSGKRILVLGIAYRSEVDDTRYAPAEKFVRAAEAEGAVVTIRDPHVRYWSEMERAVESDLPDANDLDAVVFAVPHTEYRRLDVGRWLGSARPFVFDADNVLSTATIHALKEAGVAFAKTGSGRVD